MALRLASTCRYYAYHPYAYHRCTRFAFGVGFYPVGATVTTLPSGAVIVNQSTNTYY